MYERMLDKEITPSMNDMLDYIGQNGRESFISLLEYFRQNYGISGEVRFPFGNNYGWGLRFKYKNKTLCYVFPENGAFTVFFQIGKKELPKLLNVISSLLPATQEYWNNRYPCGDGGWLHYRVFNKEEIEDIKLLIGFKQKPISLP